MIIFRYTNDPSTGYMNSQSNHQGQAFTHGTDICHYRAYIQVTAPSKTRDKQHRINDIVCYTMYRDD